MPQHKKASTPNECKTEVQIVSVDPSSVSEALRALSRAFLPSLHLSFNRSIHWLADVSMRARYFGQFLCQCGGRRGVTFNLRRGWYHSRMRICETYHHHTMTTYGVGVVFSKFSHDQCERSRCALDYYSYYVNSLVFPG